MTAILSLHQDFIHFNLANPWDQEDTEKAQAYVEERTCPEWRRISDCGWYSFQPFSTTWLIWRGVL
jgi:hypothetical protein